MNQSILLLPHATSFYRVVIITKSTVALAWLVMVPSMAPRRIGTLLPATLVFHLAQTGIGMSAVSAVGAISSGSTVGGKTSPAATTNTNE